MHPLNIAEDKSRHITFDYTNHDGLLKTYTVIPHDVFFAKSKFYPEQWHLEATDVDRNVVRQFKLDGLRNVRRDS